MLKKLLQAKVKYEVKRYCLTLKEFCQQISDIFSERNKELCSRNDIECFFTRSFDRVPVLIHYIHKDRLFKIEGKLSDKEILQLIKYWPKQVTALELDGAQNEKIGIVLKRVKCLLKVNDRQSGLELLKYAFHLNVFDQFLGKLSSSLAIKGHRFNKLAKIVLWDTDADECSLRLRCFSLRPLYFSKNLKSINKFKVRHRRPSHTNLTVTTRESGALNSSWLQLFSLNFKQTLNICYNDIHVAKKQEKIMWMREFKMHDCFIKYSPWAFEEDFNLFMTREYYSFAGYEKLKQETLQK